MADPALTKIGVPDPHVRDRERTGLDLLLRIRELTDQPGRRDARDGWAALLMACADELVRHSPDPAEGDSGVEQRGRAWASVWQTLERLGVYSWLSPDAFTNPAAMTGRHRATTFIEHLAGESDRLRELVRHCWVHSGYPNCGRDQMTTDQKALYDRVVGEAE